MKSKDKKSDESKVPQMTSDQRMAFHQGALSTLVGERNELIRVVQSVEQLINAHVEELKKLGVKFPEEKK